MSKNRKIQSILLGLVTLLSSTLFAARIISEHGYDNLVELDNGKCLVILEPNMGGRVLSYRYEGTEVLHQNPDQAGLHHSMDENVLHIAGGRFDIGPAFKNVSGRILWQGPWTAEITGTYSARMTSRIDPGSGIQLIRDFELSSTGTHLLCRQTILNRSKTEVWTFHWGRTMAKGGGIAFAPIPDEGHFPAGYAISAKPRGTFNFLPPSHPDARIRDGILEFQGAPGGNKTIFNLDEGWMAYLLPDNVLFIKTFPFDPSWRYGDPTQHHGSYWWLEDKMIEIEPNGPLELIPPGKSASFHENWFLVPFPFPEDRMVNLDELRETISSVVLQNR